MKIKMVETMRETKGSKQKDKGKEWRQMKWTGKEEGKRRKTGKKNREADGRLRRDAKRKTEK